MKSHYNTSTNISGIVQLVVTIMTVLAVIAGSIALINGSLKVIKTAASLAALNDNIQYYNESARKTDEMTAEVEEWFQIRSEKYYHSEDALVRIYSNQNAFLKLIIAILAFLAIPGIIFMDGYYLFYFAKGLAKGVNQKKRLQQLRQNRRIGR